VELVQDHLMGLPLVNTGKFVFKKGCVTVILGLM
jgi:hypothetical protein